MLRDIEKITQVIFDRFIPDNQPLTKPRRVYDVYRSLQSVILAIPNLERSNFEIREEETGFGSQENKWKYFFNKELLSLNKAIKEYLETLSWLAFKHPSKTDNNFMFHKYKQKSIFSFIRDRYNINTISDDSMFLNSTILSIDFDYKILDMEELVYMETTDFSSYKKRLELSNQLEVTKRVLLNEHLFLQEYIYKNYLLEDVMILDSRCITNNINNKYYNNIRVTEICKNSNKNKFMDIKVLVDNIEILLTYVPKNMNIKVDDIISFSARLSKNKFEKEIKYYLVLEEIYNK